MARVLADVACQLSSLSIRSILSLIRKQKSWPFRLNANELPFSPLSAVASQSLFSLTAMALTLLPWPWSVFCSRVSKSITTTTWNRRGGGRLLNCYYISLHFGLLIFSSVGCGDYIYWRMVVRCTVGQNNQEYRLKYWVTPWSIRSFAHTAHSWESKWMVGYFFCAFFSILDHSAMVDSSLPWSRRRRSSVFLPGYRLLRQ